MSGWSCDLRKVEGGGKGRRESRKSFVVVAIAVFAREKVKMDKARCCSWQSDSHFVTLIVFVVRRKLLEATLLSRLKEKTRQRV